MSTLCPAAVWVFFSRSPPELLEYLLQVGLKDIATVLAKELGTALPSAAVIKSLDVGMSAARLQMEHTQGWPGTLEPSWVVPLSWSTFRAD